MSGRRSTTPCSRSQRVVYHVSQISRPLTAVTVRFLKISDSAMSIVAGPRRNPEEDEVAAVPDDAERVLDRSQRAGHLEHDADSHSFVLLDEPRGDVVDLVDVHDRVGAERPRELHPERDVIRGEEPPRAERLRDRDREEADRPATEDGHGSSGEILRRRREDGVPERLLQARDLGRELRAIVAPHDRGRDGDVVGEASVTIDAEDLRLLAHVRLPGSAVEADAARDVALRRDVVALLDVAHGTPDRDHRSAQLMPEREWRRHALRRPLVPARDVQIGAADRGRLDPDENLVRPGCRYGDLVELEAWR